jgi:hypothetical protein
MVQNTLEQKNTKVTKSGSRHVSGHSGRQGMDQETGCSHGRVAEEQVSLPPPPSSNRTDGFPVSGFTVLSRYKAIHRGVNKGSHKGRRPRRCSLA